MQKFLNMLSSISPLQDYKDVSYDVELLFTNISIEETINYIIEQILCLIKSWHNLFEIDFQKIIAKTCYRMYF